MKDKLNNDERGIRHAGDLLPAGFDPHDAMRILAAYLLNLETTFDDFKNQVEFAKLASQLNLHVRDTVIAPLDILSDGGVGREFDMYGATTFENGKTHLSVVPVILVPIPE